MGKLAELAHQCAENAWQPATTPQADAYRKSLVNVCEQAILEYEKARPQSHEFALGRLFEFQRMKTERPYDPCYWDMHEENEIREHLKPPEAQ